MNGLETEYAGQINFVALDAGESENFRIQQDYGLRGHPSVAILNKDGQVTQRYFGAKSAETLRDALNELLP